MKAARIALRSAAPLAGASAGSGRLPQEVEQFSRFSPSPLSIKQLLDFGECREERGEVGAGVQRGSEARFPAGGVRERRSAGRRRRRSPPGAVHAQPALKSLPPPRSAARRRTAAPPGIPIPARNLPAPRVAPPAAVSRRPGARRWRPVSATIVAEDALRHRWGGVRGWGHGGTRAAGRVAHSVGRSRRAERTRCSRSHYRFGSSVRAWYCRRHPEQPPVYRGPECFLGDCN